ncbi:MAG: universal stress protein [Rhodovibrionaceae bacterium]|nr:universal stress protein [Rhodovibrionaceae bacterium]
MATKKIEEVLVAVDGSDNADRAVDMAADLAQERGARLTVLTVLPRYDLPEELKSLADSEHIEGSPMRQWELVGERLAGAARDRALEGRSGLTVTEAVLGGEPGEAIIDAARRGKADLVVIGSRGLGRLEGLLLGSVSQKVVSLAPMSVLVVR